MLEGEFISGRHGRLLCVVHRPIRRPCEAIIVVPAFGEEMNKTRRMITKLGRALEAHDIALLVPDLSGTGDSEGEFADSGWRNWVDDLASVSIWAQEHGLQMRGVLAVRTGALLAAEYVQTLSQPLAVGVLWQPVRSGTVFIRQLLRTRAMATAIGSGRREIVEDMMAEIERGGVVRVGGYQLSSTHVDGMIASDLRFDCEHIRTLRVAEVTSSVEKQGDFTEQFGSIVAQGTRFVGQPYWGATETICDENVVMRTAQWFVEEVGAHGI